jgi:glycosyltransferase involved in cell wall biosynthesis
MGGVDALYCQNFASPSRRSAVFLHDVLFQSNPEWFTRLERVYFGLMTSIASFAHVVLTSSKSEKSRIISHNPRLKNVIHTGLGMSPAFTDGTTHRDVPGLRPGSFLLSVGRLNARKNLGRTIEAALKSDVLSPDFPLVVVGEASGKTEDLSYAAQAAVTDGRVRFMGFMADDNLLWLYANASLMTFLSLGEGYGLPPVEAMVLGTRVLVSDLPVMRENLGDYATYVDPTNVDEVANAINEVCKGDGPAGRPAAIPSWERVVTVSRTALVGGDATSKKGSAAA